MAEYIERRALMEDARHDKAIMANLAGIADIANLINDQPTADAVEVRHGEWVDYETDEPYGPYGEKAWYKCSKCQKDAYGRCAQDEWYSSPILSDYCPFCGAKMDGKGEGE